MNKLSDYILGNEKTKEEIMEKEEIRKTIREEYGSIAKGSGNC